MTTASSKKTSRGSGRKKSKAKAAAAEAPVPRAVSGFDDDEVMVSGGASQGHGYGVCGGRVMSSRLEADLCDRLSRRGITHSHSPRHFEVQLTEGKLAAYAPMIVLRGRGRGGKTVVIEGLEQLDKSLVAKIEAFRERYGLEFYVIMVAPEDFIDLVARPVYDESCTTTDLGTLINRLAD